MNDLFVDNQALHKVQDWLARLTYKPGTMFTAHHDFAGQIVIDVQGSLFNTYAGDQVVVRLEDTRGRGGEYIGSMRGPMVKVQTRWTVPEMFTSNNVEHEFRRWLRSQILEWEVHEADEWLKEVGNPVPIFDPHRQEKVLNDIFEEANDRSGGV